MIHKKCAMTCLTMIICVFLCVFSPLAFAMDHNEALNNLSEPQRAIMGYVDQINASVDPQYRLTTKYELYDTYASFGNSVLDPTLSESELSINMYQQKVSSIVLTTSDVNAFSSIGKSILSVFCLNDLEYCIKQLNNALDEINKHPTHSIKNQVHYTYSNNTQLFINFTPNKYKDNRNWIELTVYPANSEISPDEETYLTEKSYQDNWFIDSYLPHYDVQITAAPSPDDELWKW